MNMVLRSLEHLSLNPVTLSEVALFQVVYCNIGTKIEGKESVNIGAKIKGEESINIGTKIKGKGLINQNMYRTFSILEDKFYVVWLIDDEIAVK